MQMLKDHDAKLTKEAEASANGPVAAQGPTLGTGSVLGWAMSGLQQAATGLVAGGGGGSSSSSSSAPATSSAFSLPAAANGPAGSAAGSLCAKVAGVTTSAAANLVSASSSKSLGAGMGASGRVSSGSSNPMADGWGHEDGDDDDGFDAMDDEELKVGVLIVREWCECYSAVLHRTSYRRS